MVDLGSSHGSGSGQQVTADLNGLAITLKQGNESVHLSEGATLDLLREIVEAVNSEFRLVQYRVSELAEILRW